LRLALSSVQQQGIREIEILVIDDGSTDGTSDWLAEQSFDRHQLRILRGPGKGPAMARNLAISNARAPFVAFLDSDDMWWPSKLSRQLAFHEANSHVGLSFTDYLHVDGDSRSYGSCFQYWRFNAGADAAAFKILQDAEATILGTNVIGTSTVMVRASDLRRSGGFSNVLPSATDWDLWLRLAGSVRIAATPATLATYLINRPGNMTSRAQARIDAIEEVLARYRQQDSAVYRRAQRLVKARLAEARADSHLLADEHFQALFDRLRVLAMRPSRRTIRATGGQVRNVLRLAQQWSGGENWIPRAPTVQRPESGGPESC